MKMSKTLLWLLTLLWFGGGAWWYSQSQCSQCNQTPAPAAVTKAAAMPALVVADSALNLFNSYNLRFFKSADSAFVSPTTASTLDSLAAYVVSNKKNLTITGYYDAAEKNTTTYENLGIARAAALKQLLVKKGIAESTITLTAVQSADLYFTPTDTLVGGISFQLSNAVPAKTETALLFEPRTVYFNTAANSLNVDGELKRYLDAAKIYLAANPAKKLVITGHTDNVGDADRNLILSKARAEFVKNQLAKRGIPVLQMAAEGRGMQNPVADNADEAGRAKNRRVTIELQ